MPPRVAKKKDYGREKDYSRFFGFQRRFRAASKGANRECVVDMSWHRYPDAFGTKVNCVIAIATSSEVRVLQEYHYMPMNRTWQMLLKKKYLEEVHHIKWHPEARILAIGLLDSSGTVIVELLEWGVTDIRPRRINVTCNASDFYSLDWNFYGSMLLLATQINNVGVMIIAEVCNDNIIKDDIQTQEVKTPYDASFCARFVPQLDYIFSISETSKTMQVWYQSDSIWTTNSNIPIRTGINISKMCFSNDGDMLAAIGVNLQVWNCRHTQVDGDCVKFSLTKKNIETSDGLKERHPSHGPTLAEHCSNAISLDFSRDSTIVTGSSFGSLCLHEALKSKKEGFLSVSFRYEHVQEYDPQGEIGCVAIDPTVRGRSPSVLPKIISGGSDGIVCLWLVSYLPTLSVVRNELYDMNCYAPEYEVHKDDFASWHDVLSIESVPEYSEEPPQETTRQESPRSNPAVSTSEASNPVESTSQAGPTSEDGSSVSLLTELEKLSVLSDENEQRIQAVESEVENLKKSVQQQGSIVRKLIELVRPRE